jgi:AcrR family transcriptional regulator
VLVPPTSHHPTRRQESAAYTRRAILDAASDLFTRRGYAATTINDVAAAAHVAVATVYTSVGGKPTLLRALIERGVDEPQTARVLEQVAAATDPAEVVRLIAAGTRHSNERNRSTVDLMISTARTVPELADAMSEALSAYRRALGTAADRLDALSALRPGLTTARAADILWFFFGLYAWRQLVGDSGWPWDDAQEWLTGLATEALLAPST